ncbi:hypothetical protein FACS1894102_4870 [Spirochaetia bacterium]|nr:hypothetical protein FACS1894102_4870 [Spirochaetia bacterium]
MRRYKIFALFLSSIAGISYELYVMRVFSIGGSPSFGSLVISTALLGVGLSGILITLSSKRVEKYSDKILRSTAISLPMLMSAAVVVAGLVPFNPLYLSEDSKQFLYIGLYYLIYGVPFFVSSLFIGTMFFAMRSQIQNLYFWNMLGSGIGGFFIIIFMFFLPPDFLILPILVVTIIAAFLISIDGENKISIKKITALCICSLASLIMVFSWGGIRVSDTKPISYVQKYPDAKLVHHSFSPGGEYHVYYSKYFHFAPGLSDNASLRIPLMPLQPYWGMFIDGEGPIGVMGYLRENEKEYMDYLPMASPYTLMENPKVLLINLSGGINTQIARYKEASRIDIIEPSNEIIDILKYDKNITRFNGGLLAEKNINVVQNEGRTWCASHKKSYDLIEISLTDSIGLTESGGYPVHEDYKWTVEAFKEYFSALKPDGILSITVWDKLNPPRNVLKLVNTISVAMKEYGMYNPETHFYSFGLFMSTTTILVKHSAWSEEELEKLSLFVESRSFDTFYSPGDQITPSFSAINTLLNIYKKQFLSQSNQSSSANNVQTSDFYKAAIPLLLTGHNKNIENNYIFDIREIRDSRPYYSGSLKLNLFKAYIKNIKAISEEWGYLLLLGMLLQGSFFGIIVIVVPLIFAGKIFRSQRIATHSKKLLCVVLYYAALGLCYMLTEIYLIQRLGLFLVNPIYSTSIVITVMLISSALGNLISGKFKKNRCELVRFSCVAIAILLFFYMLALGPILNASARTPFFAHILIAVLVIAPCALFMGVPYPNGLDSLQKNSPSLLPWAWGLNGGLSVAGSALARVISVSSGFDVLLLIGLSLYLGAALLFKKANE